LYTRDNIPFETTSLVVLVMLTAGFTLYPFYLPDGSRLGPGAFLLGFGHKALIAVCALMIMGEGLMRTGSLEPVGRFLSKLWRSWPKLALLVTIMITAVLSMFINDTPVVVLMLPILVGVGMRAGIPASGFLMPMGFASILGGMHTTIGTSTNLLVVNVAADMGMASFDMFDYTRLAAVGGAFAILYLWLIAPKLLPERQAPMGHAISRVYTAQIRLDDSSPVADRNLAEAIERAGNNLRVETIQRGQNVFISPLPDVVLKPGDRITISDTQDRLREFARILGGTLFSGDHVVDATHPLKYEGQQIAEVAVTPASSLIGTRIGDAQLRSRYGLRLLALNRYEGSRERRSLGLDDTELLSGDVLLVQSTTEDLARLKNTADFLVLDGGVRLPKKGKAPIALLTMVSVVLLAALRVIPIEISALLGCLTLIVTGSLSWKEAMNALSPKVILIVVASLAMGTALLQTGGADIIAQGFVAMTFGAAPALVLAGLMLLMAILTNIVTNNAAAVIGTPIAIGIAQRLGMPLEPFVLAVVFGANLSYVTPMAYQTHLLIMNAAGYKFVDFVRVGLPLAVMLWIVLSAALVLAYGI
jgi:di/tricarboxylate transporter